MPLPPAYQFFNFLPARIWLIFERFATKDISYYYRIMWLSEYEYLKWINFRDYEPICCVDRQHENSDLWSLWFCTRFSLNLQFRYVFIDFAYRPVYSNLGTCRPSCLFHLPPNPSHTHLFQIPYKAASSWGVTSKPKMFFYKLL